MSSLQKDELHHRLDAHFATLRSSSLTDSLKRSAGTWRLYTAVTGSAIAMATGAAAAVIQGGPGTAAQPVASVMPGNLHLLSSRNLPFLNAMKLAVATATTTPATQTQSQKQAPSISPGGIVPLYSTAGVIQPGEWVSIYGTNLASQTTLWNNDFPLLLGGTSVTINNKPAYLLFVSPGQINLQAPDDTATGTVSVVVTTAAGSFTSTVTLSQFAPSFSLIDSKHVAAIILRDNGRGAYGGGTFDILGPTGNSLGYETVAAKAGDNVELFGIGFGPTTPVVPAGQMFSGAASTNFPLTLYIDNIAVKATFTGISSAGLYQINLKIPYGLGSGDVPLQAMVGGLETQAGVFISLEDPAIGSTGNTGTVGVPVGSAPAPPFVSAFPPGTFFSGGGSGGGASSNARKHRFEPKKLYFPPAR